ncbi:MAG: LptF/LptG family permease [Planctomycetota bacterium]|nr:LptF/LptG family permease [Planctomycetota bacterium]MDI6787953.1 LptF/LptG family permease [Planctomycetota bacterium]
MINKALFTRTIRSFVANLGIRKLDYYILKSFLFAFIIAVLCLSGLYIVIHFFTNLFDFTELTQQSVFLFIPYYYLIRLPVILYKLLPIIVLIALMITISRLSKIGELIAMMASGIGIHRIVIPILIAILFIVGTMYFADEVFTPYLGKYISLSDKILKSEGSERFLIRQTSQAESAGDSSMEAPRVARHQFTIKKYNYVKHQMNNIWVNEYDGTNNLIAQIVAERALWSVKKDRQGWLLHHGIAYHYDEKGFRSSAPHVFSDESYLLKSELTPDSIEKIESTFSYMNSTQLKNILRSQPDNSLLKVQYYSRMTSPLSVLILVFLGLPFALGGGKRGTITGIGICLILSLGFFIIKTFFESMGNKGIINPFLSVTIPLIIFAIIGIILSRRIRT